MKMMFFFLLFVVTSPVNGAFWSRSQTRSQEVAVKEGHRVVIKFGEETDHGETKVFISEHESSSSGAAEDDGFASPGELFATCKSNLASVFKTTKNFLLNKSHEFHNSEDEKEEVTDESAVEKNNMYEKITEKVKTVAEKVTDAVLRIVKSVDGGKTVGFFFGEGTKGTLKDYVVKMEEWDVVDSPKRIGEDIAGNASGKIVEGVEQVKETVVETVKESSLNDVITKSKEVVADEVIFLEEMKSVISRWFHLLGFWTAYGMGIWMTFFSKYVLSKCLPEQQFGMVLNKMNMVYFKAMAYCVGSALLGYLVMISRRIKEGFLLNNNKMEIFQGFNLVSALIMILINLVVLEPRATKLIVERMKIPMKEMSQMKAMMKKLKRLNAYSSTLNVLTMVVLTWHLAYIGQLLRALS